MKFLAVLFTTCAALCCDLTHYKPLDGLKAEQRQDILEITWLGERGEQLRVAFTIHDGQPVIHELAARRPGAPWTLLAHDVVPEFEVTTGKRRLSEQQMAPLRELGVDFTPALVDKEKWNAFWDSPLMVPGRPGTNMDLPRKPDEVRRDWAKFSAGACEVKSEGARLEVSFPGLDLGLFAGKLQYTIYRGVNLIRQEAIAATDEPSVAYRFESGLKGFPIAKSTRVVWRDVARAWQQYEFGGAPNKDNVALRARNRLVILEAGAGSLAFLPPSHKFFFAREIETNLGYVYYRKESENSMAIGVRQGEHEEGPRPWGLSDDEWNRRVAEARGDSNNFALYNAPPGTEQRMAIYLYLSPENSHATQEHVMAFTHDDVYKPVPGFKVLVSHFHFHLNELLQDAGSVDIQPTWLPTFRALGINIAILADFHGDGHATDTGKLRFNDQKFYFDGCAAASDRNFLCIPGEEPDANFGGHYMFVFPKPVYFSHLRQPKSPPNQPFEETVAPYGKVYHTTTAATELELLKKEDGLVWQTHPRTKGSAGYPDATRTTDFFNSDRFLGGSFQSLPVDLSEKRLCEARCLALLDDMNNWTGPKYMLAEGDTYNKFPDDETYPQLIVNYVKLDAVPRYQDGWAPVLKALRNGDYYVTSGEVLFHNWSIEGTGPHRFYNADVEWTFPPEFAELVWGDGQKTNREIISLTNMAPLTTHHFRVPFDTAGKKWVRFAVWDSAGNGALTQPVHLGATSGADR